MQITQKLKAHVALFLVNTLYGASHIVAKGIMPVHLTPNVFIFFRAAGATLLFWLTSFFFVREKVEKKDLLRLAICGIFGVTVNQLFFFHGLNLSSSINSGIIMTVNPMLVVVLSFFLLKERITYYKVSGIIIASIGAILLTLSSGSSKGDSMLGDLFLFINAFSYAIYLVIAKPLMQKYKPLTVITYVFTFGLGFIMLYPPTLTEFFATDYSSFTFEITAKVIYVIIGVTFFTYLLTMYALKYLSPSISSSYIYLQPVLVVFFAFLFSATGLAADYTNTITLEKSMYALLIFAGVYIVSRTKKSV